MDDRPVRLGTRMLRLRRQLSESGLTGIHTSAKSPEMECYKSVPKRSLPPRQGKCRNGGSVRSKLPGTREESTSSSFSWAGDRRVATARAGHLKLRSRGSRTCSWPQGEPQEVKEQFSLSQHRAFECKEPPHHCYQVGQAARWCENMLVVVAVGTDLSSQDQRRRKPTVTLKTRLLSRSFGSLSSVLILRRPCV